MVALLEKKKIASKSSLRNNAASSLGLMFVNISKYELSGRKDEFAPKSFRKNWDLFFSDPETKAIPRLRDELDSIYKQYAQAVAESVILKKQREDQRLAEGMEKQRQSDLTLQQMSEAAGQKKAMADAQAASKRAEDETRAAAVQQAMTAQAEVKRKKLQEVVESPAYKLWEASVRVEEGMRLIDGGQKELASETAIERESGVVNLTKRRAAGERVAAGKLLVDEAFEAFRSLGGEAVTPEEVKAGPDPAAEYR